MKQTQHYGLSQWDLSDRIQMEDFNRDNRLLDTALSTLSQAISASPAGTRLELILQDEGYPGYVTTSRSIFELTDWNDWNAVGVLMEIPSHEVSSAGKLSATLDNGGSVSTRLNIVQFTGLAPFHYCLFLLFPGHDANSTVQGLFLTPDRMKFFHNNYKFQQFGNTMRIAVRVEPDTAGTLAGGQYTVFGVR